MAKRNSRNINLIVIHCSATSELKDYTPEMMERDHRERGFNSAGYHFYIRRSGYRHPLRPLQLVGAHVLGFNKESIGVCYEGGINAKGKPADTRTDAQKEAMKQLLEELVVLYPDAQIVGHRDLSPDLNGDGVISPDEWIKQCPCFDAKKEYKNI
ncbi:MAG: N-acetylmuramoyl-L-alanine amidase [Dehalococcoidales bacterium]